MKHFLSLLLAPFIALFPLIPVNADSVLSSQSDGHATLETPANFIIDSLQYAELDHSPGFHHFIIETKGIIRSTQFNDGRRSWGMVIIDTDSDGYADFRIETTLVDLVGRYGSPANIYAVEGSVWNEIPGCTAQFYSDIDREASYVGFRVAWDCMKLPSDFAFDARLGYENRDSYGDRALQSGKLEATHSFNPSQQPSIAVEAPTASELVSSAVSSPSSAPDDLDGLVAEVAKSVVTVFCGDAKASGWSADVKLTPAQVSAGLNSFVVANYSVVEKCVDSGLVTIELIDGSLHKAFMVSADEENDLIGLATAAEVPGLKWRGQTPSHWWWAGSLIAPRGQSGYLHTGLINLLFHKTGLVATNPWPETNAPGGPVFDRDGRVIATVSKQLLDTQSLGFAKASPLLCIGVISCSSYPVWSAKPSVDANDEESNDLEEAAREETVLVQRAGSQVFVTSSALEASFEIYENDQFLDDFHFDGGKQAHIVEQRVTGEISLKKWVGGVPSWVKFEPTRSLLWYQNVNLGAPSETVLGSSAEEKVRNLVNHRFFDSGTWKPRDSKVTKFICTGIYREGATFGEKLSARKKAKLACATAMASDIDSESEVSFYYQTKPTMAQSYEGKVLVTVKGIQPFVASRLDN